MNKEVPEQTNLKNSSLIKSCRIPFNDKPEEVTNIPLPMPSNGDELLSYLKQRFNNFDSVSNPLLAIHPPRKFFLIDGHSPIPIEMQRCLFDMEASSVRKELLK